MAAHECSAHDTGPPPRRPTPVTPEPSEAYAPVAPGREPSPSQLLGLQQMIGNAAVQRLVQRSKATRRLIQRQEEAHIPLEVAPGAADLEPGLQEETAVQLMAATGEAPAGATGAMLQRWRLAAATTLIQRFAEDDVKTRARDIWERKGSPQNQSKEEQDKDYFEARHQLESEERAHGIWEEKGKPQGQSEAERKKDYSDAEVQLKAVKEMDGAADAGAVKTTLLSLQKAGTEWRVLRYVFKAVKDSVRNLIRGDDPTKTLAFSLGPTAADKAELIYYLKGDEAWKRQAMTDNGVDDNTYREALVRLRVFEKGTAAHKTGPEVDALIGKHLKSYVERNLEARGKVTGRIAVVDNADWDIIGRTQYGGQWNAKRTTLNAFVDRTTDPPRVFVNKDRGNAGTAIHEGVHFWGSAARPINGDSHNLNEGVTEYFARKVCSALEPPIPRAVYAQEHAIASKMIAEVGEEPVASAFFDGNLPALKAAFGTDQRWRNFCTFVEAKAWGQAEDLLKKLKERTGAKDVGDFEVGDLFSNIG